MLLEKFFKMRICTYNIPYCLYWIYESTSILNLYLWKISSGDTDVNQDWELLTWGISFRIQCSFVSPLIIIGYL